MWKHRYCSLIDYKYISLQLDKYIDVITLIVSILIFIDFIIALNLSPYFHIYRLICKFILIYLPSSVSLFVSLFLSPCLFQVLSLFSMSSYSYIHIFSRVFYLCHICPIYFILFLSIYSYIYPSIILALPRIRTYTPEFLYYWHCENIIVRNYSQ